MSPSPPSTREKILAAAEPLFARHGSKGVSLRQITAAAKVNLAAVNYHFYDKERLYLDLVRKRLRQIQGESLALLDAAQQRAGAEPVPLEEIASALARPLLLPSAATGPHAPRLLGRLLFESENELEDVITREFVPGMTRFAQACRRHVPGLPPEDFFWRFSQVIGALHHLLLTLPTLGRLTRGLCRAEEPERALTTFTHLLGGTFAPRP